MQAEPFTFHFIGRYDDLQKPKSHLKGHLEYFHYLTYSPIVTDREDGRTGLAKTFNSSKAVVLMDLKMIGIETTFYSVN